MSSSPKTFGSPKTCSSPARVRHNPYARSPASVNGTPVDLGAGPMSPNDSFATLSMPPLTPPTAAVPPAVWPGADETTRRFNTADFVPAPDFAFVGEPAMMGGFVSAQPSYYSDVPAYDAVDPSIAVAMYSAASAAAASAAAAARVGPSSYGHDHHQVQQYGGHQKGNRRDQQQQQMRAAELAAGAVPRFEDLQGMVGTLAEHARTANGSSYIQSAVKDSNDIRCLHLVWAELSNSLGDLLLDAHGCYVIKTLLERLPAEEISYVLASIGNDEQLGFSICTHSLHTRRVVQHIIENVDGGFLCELMARHCAEIAMTQQGCIVMQRAMDHAPAGPARDALFQSISTNLIAFAKDPFANYVVQHLMEVGERSETAGAMWKAFRGRVVELACNKFASNVIEKCLFHCTADVQHEILTEMYSVGPQMLYNMLQDSFGNYIIQSSIALATFRDVSMIDEQLRPVLVHTPYGHKIEARLDRRLKGKPVTARATPPTAGGAAVPATTSAPPAAAKAPHSRGGRGGNRGGGEKPLPNGEVPW